VKNEQVGHDRPLFLGAEEVEEGQTKGVDSDFASF